MHRHSAALLTQVNPKVIRVGWGDRIRREALARRPGSARARCRHSNCARRKSRMAKALVAIMG